MEGFGYVGAALFALPFTLVLLIVARLILRSRFGRTREGVALAAVAIAGAAALPVVAWVYLIG